MFVFFHFVDQMCLLYNFLLLITVLLLLVRGLRTFVNVIPDRLIVVGL